MANLPTVFISYNPHSEIEQTLAIRLHSIGAVHGFNMLLPDRSFSQMPVSNETRARIHSADFFIVFSTTSLSHAVSREIEVAFEKLKDRSRILVVYDNSIGKNVTLLTNCTEVYVNTQEDPLKIVTEITKKIKEVNSSPEDNLLSSLGGILLIGIGLFTLSEMVSEPEPSRRPKRIPAKISRKKKRV